MTTLKSRRPLAEVSRTAPILNKSSNASSSAPKEQTVEQYLEEQCSNIIKDLRLHGAELIQKLREQHAEGVQEIQNIINSTVAEEPASVFIVLKCIGGPHLAQKFRLDMTEGADEDVFKMGRSTGRNFKEHGVSLYKDKEISTTHARIEVRNRKVFLIDNRSTNGTQINNEDVEPQSPVLLKTGDVITMGGTELEVMILNGTEGVADGSEQNEDEDEANVASV